MTTNNTLYLYNKSDQTKSIALECDTAGNFLANSSRVAYLSDLSGSGVQSVSAGIGISVSGPTATPTVGVLPNQTFNSVSTTSLTTTSLGITNGGQLKIYAPGTTLDLIELNDDISGYLFYNSQGDIGRYNKNTSAASWFIDNSGNSTFNSITPQTQISLPQNTQVVVDNFNPNNSSPNPYPYFFRYDISANGPFGYARALNQPWWYSASIPFQQYLLPLSYDYKYSLLVKSNVIPNDYLYWKCPVTGLWSIAMDINSQPSWISSSSSSIVCGVISNVSSTSPWTPGITFSRILCSNMSSCVNYIEKDDYVTMVSLYQNLTSVGGDNFGNTPLSHIDFRLIMPVSIPGNFTTPQPSSNFIPAPAPTAFNYTIAPYYSSYSPYDPYNVPGVSLPGSPTIPTLAIQKSDNFGSTEWLGALATGTLDGYLPTSYDIAADRTGEYIVGIHNQILYANAGVGSTYKTIPAPPAGTTNATAIVKYGAAGNIEWNANITSTDSSNIFNKGYITSNGQDVFVSTKYSGTGISMTDGVGSITSLPNNSALIIRLDTSGNYINTPINYSNITTGITITQIYASASTLYYSNTSSIVNGEYLTGADFTSVNTPTIAARVAFVNNSNTLSSTYNLTTTSIDSSGTFIYRAGNYYGPDNQQDYGAWFQDAINPTTSYVDISANFKTGQVNGFIVAYDSIGIPLWGGAMSWDAGDYNYVNDVCAVSNGVYYCGLTNASTARTPGYIISGTPCWNPTQIQPPLGVSLELNLNNILGGSKAGGYPSPYLVKRDIDGVNQWMVALVFDQTSALLSSSTVCSGDSVSVDSAGDVYFSGIYNTGITLNSYVRVDVNGTQTLPLIYPFPATGSNTNTFTLKLNQYGYIYWSSYTSTNVSNPVPGGTQMVSSTV